MQPRHCIQGPPPVRYVASAALVREMASVMNLCLALCQMANVYILAIFQYSDNPNHRRDHGSSPPNQTSQCSFFPNHSSVAPSMRACNN